MANTLLTPTAITREALRILHTECALVKNVDKQHDGDTTFGGQKRGATIKIRLPNRYAVRTGWPIDVQDTTEESVDLVVATVRGVDLYLTDAELAQSLDDFSRRILRPAISRLAAEIDRIVYENSVKAIYNLVGTAGTTPATALVYLQAGQRLNEFLAPQADRKVIIDPAAQAATVNGLATLFNPQSTIGKQYTEGSMGRALGFEWFMSQNVPSITNGTRATSTSFQVNATVSTEGSNQVAIKGLSGATQTVRAGEVFTINGVFAVNPETKAVRPFLQQFVVLEDATASSSVVTVSVAPKFYSSASGPLQTVSAMPLENATVTFTGAASTSYPRNLAFHPEAITFATAKLEMPSDVNFKAQEVMDGIGMRILRQYDINSANYPCRIDVLCGSVVQRPELACQIVG